MNSFGGFLSSMLHVTFDDCASPALATSEAEPYPVRAKWTDRTAVSRLVMLN